MGGVAVSAWQGSTRKARLPKDWPQRRARVLKRDLHRCQLQYPRICIGHATEVDHRCRGDDHSDSNLQAACQPCHARKTAAEAAAARPRERRAPEPHPGLAR